MEPLDALAGAAEEHARREHHLEIRSDEVALVDRILRAEAERADPGRVENLAACYGAWLGRLIIRRWNARWTGLAEAAPPRLIVDGHPMSPVDAVRRILLDPSATTLAMVLAALEAGARKTPERDLEINRAAWDALAGAPSFTGGGELSEDSLDPWLRDEGVRGKDLLCLGAGGGRHGPLHALAGANVTVVDLSERQLDFDRRIAAVRGLKIRTVCASIDATDVLDPASFDIVLQPVSACYVPDVGPVYAGVARILRPGGLYCVQHKAPASLQASGLPPFRLHYPCSEALRLLPSSEPHREPGTIEFVHDLDALLGGLCRAGFVIEDVVEPPRGDAFAPEGSPGHRAWFLPPYLKIKARRL